MGMEKLNISGNRLTDWNVRTRTPMEIIKEGQFKPENMKQFECPHCGCIFKADTTEFSMRNLGHIENEKIGFLKYKVNLIVTGRIYSCECPKCHTRATVKEKQSKQTICSGHSMLPYNYEAGQMFLSAWNVRDDSDEDGLE